jgi:hypothetical protein
VLKPSDKFDLYYNVFLQMFRCKIDCKMNVSPNSKEVTLSLRAETKGKRYPARDIFIVFTVLVSLTCAKISYGQNYIGRQVEIVGNWNGETMEVEELEKHDMGEDPDWGQVEGLIDTVDIQTQMLRIGPMSIGWNNFTEFKGLTEDDLVPRQSIKVSGKLVRSALLAATSITVVSSPSSGLKMTGVVTKIKHLPGESMQLTLLGVPIELPGEYAMGVIELAERPDDIDMDEMHTVTLFERPLSVALEYESNVEFFIDFELEDNAEDDLLVIEQILIPEIFYPITEDISLFICLEFFFEGEYQTELERHDTVTGIDREEMWLFIGNLFESDFSLQMGRQAVEEARQWWWGDEELDAFRVHYDRRHLHAELLVGQELARRTTAEKRLDPEDEDLLRVMGQLAWGWEEVHRLDAFFLYQYDHSSGHSVGEIIREELEDPSDADLLWIGGRASGKLHTEKSGEVEYWLDAAGVFGEEDLFEFEEEDHGRSQVSSHIRHDVAGWGFDVGLTWWTDMKGRPFFNLGYAWGSGDRQSDPDKDQSFRQTGLHGSEDRFAYYGILLDPELSNLQIRTAVLGCRFLESSLIAIAYHDYRQVKTSSFLRGAEIEVDLEGSSRDIGQEWDLIVILDDWDNMELRLFGAVFRAGSAYGSLSGENAYYTGFELNYRF